MCDFLQAEGLDRFGKVRKKVDRSARGQTSAGDNSYRVTSTASMS